MQFCTEDSNGCWAPKNPTVSCSGYKLSKCPANGICSDCTDNGTKKYKLTSCNTNYYMNNNKCVSCADAYKLAKEYHDNAANSYFACCTGSGSHALGGELLGYTCRGGELLGYTCRGAGLGRCRSGSDTSYPGSWNDGFIRYYMK